MSGEDAKLFRYPRVRKIVRISNVDVWKMHSVHAECTRICRRTVIIPRMKTAKMLSGTA